MSNWNIVLFIIAFISILCAFFVIVIDRRITRNALMQIDAMLTSAMDGTFREKAYNESLLSSLETKFAHYLSASDVSTKNLAEEKERIKVLIADISHQTKTPLANILLYAQLLKEQQLSVESASCVTALNAQAEKLGFLIDSLMKISRLEAGVLKLHPKPTKVGPMLDVVLEQIAPRASTKNIKIYCNPTGAKACFDKKWTMEALCNILDNAVKYTPEGGSIHINAIAYELFFRIDISDNGIGIDEYEQAKIFGRFYRSAAVSDTEGVGIGLYLTRQIISCENGYIKVKSVPGAGAKFSVFLPMEQ